MPAIRHGFAVVNGVRLHYAEAGQGRPILFVHGFPEFWYAWKDQLQHFGSDHRAVALDMRGYNLSAKPDSVDAYRLPYLVEDLSAFCRFLGADPVTVVAHDWGGVVAWVLAMMHPGLVDRLVIINAPHPVVFQRELARNPAQRKASEYMILFRSPEAETVLSASGYGVLVERVLGDGLARGYLTDADRAAYLEAWAQPGALTGGLNWYRANRAGPPVPGQEGAGPAMPFQVIERPTLVIWGMQDTALLPGNLDRLEEWVSDLRLERIEEADHWVVHQQGDRVNGLIRDFLAR